MLIGPWAGSRKRARADNGSMERGVMRPFGRAWSKSWTSTVGKDPRYSQNWTMDNELRSWFHSAGIKIGILGLPASRILRASSVEQRTKVFLWYSEAAKYSAAVIGVPKIAPSSMSKKTGPCCLPREVCAPFDVVTRNSARARCNPSFAFAM